MSSYQDKLIFPAPEISYTVETSQGQVLYLPRDVMQKAEKRRGLGYPTNKMLFSMVQKQKLEEIEKLQKIKKERRDAKIKFIQEQSGVKSMFEIMAELSDNSDDDFDIEAYIQKQKEKQENGEQSESQDETDQTTLEKHEIQDKIEQADKIREPQNMQDRRKKSESKKTSQHQHVDQILSQVRKLDKISYVERACEFEPYLAQIQQDRANIWRRKSTNQSMKTEQMKAIQKEILDGSPLEEDSFEKSAISNPYNKFQSEIIGENVNKQLQQEMDVEDAAVDQKLSKMKSEVKPKKKNFFAKQKEKDQRAQLNSSPFEEEFAHETQNDNNDAQGLNKNTMPPTLVTKSMQEVEQTTQQNQKKQKTSKWKKNKNQSIPNEPVHKLDLQSELSKSKSIKVSNEDLEKKRMIDHIPMLYLPYEDSATKIVIYFHGNAEDIGLAFDLLYLVGQRLQAHVIAVEYPGYGLYKQCHPNEQQIKEDALTVYDYLTKCMGIDQQDIILFGRSMGTGPTTFLSSVRQPYALILMSPYTSIKNAAKAILGWASFLGFLVQEKFRNIDSITETNCPVMVIHGKMDTLIPPSHGIDLFNAANPNVPALLHMPSKMDHNEFQLEGDLVDPIKEFVMRIKKAVNPVKDKPKQIEDSKEEKSDSFEEDNNSDDNTSEEDSDDVIEKMNKQKKAKNKKPSKDQKLSKQDSKSKLSNPYIDELEKKQIDSMKAEQREKNFHKLKLRKRKNPHNRHIDENKEEEKLKLMKDKIALNKHKSNNFFAKQKTLTEENKSEIEVVPGKSEVEQQKLAGQPIGSCQFEYFECKTSNFNMTTHCCKVDESFVDYLFEPIEFNSSEDSEDQEDLNYEDIIESLVKPEQKPIKKKKKDKGWKNRFFKPKAGQPNPSEEEEEEEEAPKKKRPDKLRFTNLVLYFDQALFEAPPAIRKLEDELMKKNGGGESAYQKTN